MDLPIARVRFAKLMLVWGLGLTLVALALHVLAVYLTDMPWDSIMAGAGGKYYVLSAPVNPGVVTPDEMEPIAEQRFRIRVTLEFAGTACLLGGAAGMAAALFSYVLGSIRRPPWWPPLKPAAKWAFRMATAVAVASLLVAIGAGVLAPRAAGLPENMIRIRHRGGTYMTGRAAGPMETRPLVPISQSQWDTWQEWDTVSTVIGAVAVGLLFILGLWLMGRGISYSPWWDWLFRNV